MMRGEKVWLEFMRIDGENLSLLYETFHFRRGTYKKVKGLAPQRKAKKNIRRNCPIWVQLGSVDTQLI